MKQEPIDAEESKLILKAIAGGDWTPNRFNATIPSPFELFNQLGINQKDGYNPVNTRTQQDVGQAMQKWLDENNGKYLDQRQVVDPNAKVRRRPASNRDSPASTSPAVIRGRGYADPTAAGPGSRRRRKSKLASNQQSQGPVRRTGPFLSRLRETAPF